MNGVNGESIGAQIPNNITIAPVAPNTVTLETPTHETGFEFTGDGAVSGLEMRGFYPAVEAFNGTVTITDMTLTDNLMAVSVEHAAFVTATNVDISDAALPDATGYQVTEQGRLDTSGGSISDVGTNCDSNGIGVYAQGLASITMDGTDMSAMGGNAIQLRDSSTATFKNLSIDGANSGCTTANAIELLGAPVISFDTVNVTTFRRGIEVDNSGVQLSLANSTFSAMNTSIEMYGGFLQDSGSTFNGNAGISCLEACGLTLTSTTFMNGTAPIAVASQSQLKLRSTSIRNFIANNTAKAILILGSGIYDFGTAQDPGNNTFVGNATELSAAAFPAADGAINAVGNIWDPSTEGANSSGLYSAQLITGPVSGKNYILSQGAELQF